MNQHRPNQTIPRAAGNWLLGSLTEFRDGMFEFLVRLRHEHGPVASFRLGPRRLIILNDPSLVEEVLVAKNRQFRKHYATRLLRPVLGNGLLLNEGDAWLRQRRLIQPAFCRRFAGEFEQIVRIHTAKLAEQWRRNRQRDLYQDMTRLTVKIAAEAFLGIDDEAETDQLGECLDVIHADFESRFLRAWNPPVWLPTARNRRLRAAVRQLSQFIDRIIASRRQDALGKHDALSLLLNAADEQGQRMSAELLRDEVMTLLLAGHDTTANALTWSWVLLSQHPDVMNRLTCEASRLQPEPQGAPDLRDRLPWAGCVIRESMRLYPPAYMIGREALSSVSIGDFQLTKGASVVMCPWVMHRDERFYSRADEFRPQRWTTEFEKSLPRYAYFPFGGGPRVCIGRELALIEATTILTTLAAEFSVRLQDASAVKPWPTVTLRVRDAVWADVTPLHSHIPKHTIAKTASVCPQQAGNSGNQE